MSTGHLHSPEQLEPNVDTRRTTASATYNRAGAEGRNWQTTFAWGRNAKSPGNTLDALLLETAASFGPAGRHTVFGRAESVALLPSQLDSAYGHRPFSWMVFLRARN